MQLTEEQRATVRNSGGTDGELARKFGVSRSTIYSIRNRPHSNGALVARNGNDKPKLTTEVTILGLQLDPGMAFHDWAAVFYDAASRWEASNWLLADALNHRHAETDEGEQLISQLCDMPRFARLTPGTRQNIKSVGKQYTLDERMDMLSFSHHGAAAYIEDHSKRAKELEEALAKKLTVKELRENIKKKRGKNGRGLVLVTGDCDSSANSEGGTTQAPTLEDFNVQRERCRPHMRAFWTVLDDQYEDGNYAPKDLVTAARPLIDSLMELVKLGEGL